MINGQSCKVGGEEMESDWGKAIKSPYVCSANELPTVKELRYQIALLKPFGLISRGLKGIRQIKEIENELNGLVSVVDRFYSLLGFVRLFILQLMHIPRSVPRFHLFLLL